MSATTIASNATWTPEGSPYILNGDVTVAPGVTLTLEPGTVVKFSGVYRTLRVSGKLNVLGSTAARVIFTSIQDDSIGGDSAGDGPSVGAPGQWFAINIRPGSTGSLIANADIRYGGYGSADWGYGAIDVADTGSIRIEDSRITDNQRSGIKLFGINATVSVLRSEIMRNGNGISVNTASVAVGDATVIGDNRSHGLWFNLPTVTNKPPASSVSSSDITRNGGNGVYIQANGDYPLPLMPSGVGNNIYGNAGGTGQQIDINGYPRFKNADLNWAGNYWGDDVYYYTNPSQCGGAAPYSSGRLAYRSSSSDPPFGPMGGDSYSISQPYPSPPIVCASAATKVRDCAFSSDYVRGGRTVVSYEGAGVSAAAAAACAAETSVTVDALAGQYSTLGGDVTAAVTPEPGATPADVGAAFEPTVRSLFDEVNAIGDFPFTYNGDVSVQRMTTTIPSLANPVPIIIAIPGLSSPCYDPWYPTEGYVEVGPSNQPGHIGKRRVYQWFKWNEANLLYFKTCRPNITLEADAIFDRSDGLTYLGDKVGAKLSNLPRRFDDTRIDDFGSETSYTMGSADAQQLVAGRKYFTLIRTKPGNASMDRMFLRFQNGVRTPPGCFSTWCVYAAAAGSDQVVLPKWQTVPGSFLWTFH